jgi:hypothetical protein
MRHPYKNGVGEACAIAPRLKRSTIALCRKKMSVRLTTKMSGDIYNRNKAKRL